MAEELQGLLDKIQQDGVAKAEARAREITEAATKEAGELIAKAKRDAADIVSKAEDDAKQFEARARKALLQAARDVILSVGEALNETAGRLVAKRLDAATGDDTLVDFVKTAITAYFQSREGGDITALLPENEVTRVREVLSGQLSEALLKGLSIESDSTVSSGFKLSEQDGRIQHDFSNAAITDALTSLLRPHLAEIVKEAANSLS